MTDRHRFLGVGAALSDLPIPREYELDHDDDPPDVEPPTGTNAVLDELPTTAYVEQFTEHGGARVRSHTHQSDAPIELILRTAIGEAALGLDPADARELAHHLQDAADECTTPPGDDR